MNQRRRVDHHKPKHAALPPIIQEDDLEFPFYKQDFFSDVAISVQGKKLFTARCLLAYNSPVFEKNLANSKKQDIELANKQLEDVIQLVCYLDPRVQYEITAQSARQLLPFAEEYEMFRLRRACENVLHESYDNLRKEYHLGNIPPDINEDYLILADRYSFEGLLHMCVEEYVHSPTQDIHKSVINSDVVSEGVKLLILERKLVRLNRALDKERRYRFDAENKLDSLTPKKLWRNK